MPCNTCTIITIFSILIQYRKLFTFKWNKLQRVVTKYTYVNEKVLIEACKQNDRKAQKALYEEHGPLLFSICKRYLPNIEDAEDVFVHGMCKIFENLHKYSGNGSFQGWMRKSYGQ